MKRMTKRNLSIGLAAAAILALSIGCGPKKTKTTTAPPPPPVHEAAPPPPEGAPAIAFFTAEPTTIEKSQPSQLRWSVKNATSIQIDHGIGEISPNGRRAVYPTATTTYTLTASGPGGATQVASATVTVATPPPPPPISTGSSKTFAELVAQLQDLHFDYDKSDVRPEDQPVLTADVAALKAIFASNPSVTIVIEGHCDERGSAEYNIGLGDRRASATKDALVALGVSGGQLKTVSFGKERPICTDATESCYQQNRRAHFTAGQ
jgi:peptidoglycan-associated lipoprotein